MSSRSKAWLVAATIGAVEASKDQLGLCRWNYMIRSVNQRIRNNVRSAAQANRFSSSSTTALASCKDCDKAKQAEESLRTVMYVSCWGPN
uniref:Wound-responsive family protein n=1 Tax=Brassica campestris TaxID=3711 RepID=M4EGS9_BRACM